MSYQEFLAAKEAAIPSCKVIDIPALNPMLFPFQRDIVSWALRIGRAAIFADCGMGKTPMQLEWARHVPGRVLILAPLAVAQQTIRESAKFGVDVEYSRNGTARGRIVITNYEMLERFNPADFDAVILDESSILKAYTGKIRTQIIEAFQKTPFRLACTATPAPNDFMEIGNHVEFLGIMTRAEMLSKYFVHDGGETQKWRLKGHAESEFWKFIGQWAVMLRRPSDLGYDDDGFILPPLNYFEHVSSAENPADGMLFAMPAETLQERIAARRETINERVSGCAEIVNGSPGQWIVWCNLNAESNALKKAIPGSIEVVGSDIMSFKEQSALDFISNRVRVLISKPSIFGFGLNFQNCHNMAFVGLSDSWESYYQAVRRCWRFGQTKPVSVHIFISELEGNIVENIKRKEADAKKMATELIANMHDLNQSALRGTMTHQSDEYRRESAHGKDWTIHLADCVEAASEIPDNSIHYSIFSPPFASLYTYSNSERDMGNCDSDAQFMEHFGFLVHHLYRILIPGRLISFHCMNLPTSKVNHGYIGIQDFRGELIRLFERAGFIFHSEVVIWKDPVVAMQRTKAIGLLHKQLKKDSCMSRQGIPDYLVTMRKPGENPERVSHTNETFPVRIWQRYASPVWMDINPSNTLQFRSAREHKDERHICPLQLQVIERGLELWTNPGDMVFSPFAGIGSEGYVSLRMGRKFIGVELKQSYWETACRNLQTVKTQASLYDGADACG